MTNIVQPSSIPVSVDYTSRDYDSLRSQLIARIQDRIPGWSASDPSDFGVALVEAVAYAGDLIAFHIDRVANESFLETATQRSSLLNISQTYGYTPAGYRQAFLLVQFSNASSSDITLPEGTVVYGEVNQGDVTQTVYFTTSTDAVVPAASGGTPGTVTQLTTEGRSSVLTGADTNAFGELIGTSDGSANQSFVLPQTPVVDNSVVVYVQAGDRYSQWEQVSHLPDYGPNDLVYSVTSDADNNVTVSFGDGVSGRLPTNFSEIRAVYTVGGGSIGNVAPGTVQDISYVPELTTSETHALQSSITVSNSSAGVAGSNPESNDSIRSGAAAAIRAPRRAVTLEDFADLGQAVSGVGKANATASTWASVVLYIAPTRLATDSDPHPGLNEDGTSSAEYLRLQDSTSSYLSDKLLLGSSLTIQPPTYVDVVLAIQYAKLPQFTTDETEANIKTALLTGFSYVRNTFQQTIYPQDVEYVLNQADGVMTAKLTAFHKNGGSGLGAITGAAGEIFRFTEDNVTLATL